MGNNILGQFGMMGRIGEVVRERAGLAYSAGTSLNAWIDAGSWEVSAGVSPANLERAIELIFSEIRRFITEPVSAEELSDSQANYIGRLPLSLESNSGVANALLNLERFQSRPGLLPPLPGDGQAVTRGGHPGDRRPMAGSGALCRGQRRPGDKNDGLRSGIDIVEINRMDEINPAIRVRFINRVFTPAEQALARGADPSLAGRFAAKEAVSKALGTGIGRVHWQDIEILRGPAGEPVLQLHGLAREVAAGLG